MVWWFYLNQFPKPRVVRSIRIGGTNLSCLRSGRDKQLGHLTSCCGKRIQLLITGDARDTICHSISVLFLCKHDSASTLKNGSRNDEQRRSDS